MNICLSSLSLLIKRYPKASPGQKRNMATMGVYGVGSSPPKATLNTAPSHRKLTVLGSLTSRLEPEGRSFCSNNVAVSGLRFLRKSTNKVWGLRTFGMRLAMVPRFIYECIYNLLYCTLQKCDM